TRSSVRFDRLRIHTMGSQRVRMRSQRVAARLARGTSGCVKPPPPLEPYPPRMTLRCDLAGMVVADMATSLAFYRRLGLDLPAELDEQPHVDVELPGGFRLAWDTIDVIKSFDPTWSPASGRGTTLAFTCDTPAEVDATYAD